MQYNFLLSAFYLQKAYQSAYSQTHKTQNTTPLRSGLCCPTRGFRYRASSGYTSPPVMNKGFREKTEAFVAQPGVEPGLFWFRVKRVANYTIGQ